MATDINRIYNGMVGAQEKIVALISELTKVKNEASGFGGEIARVLPQNLDACISTLTELYEGGSQNSLSSLLEFLDNLPYGQLRPQATTKTTLLRDEEGLGMRSAPVVDTNPNMQMAPQSAIRHESTLSDFYKDSFRENQQVQRTSGRFSFDDIKSEFKSKAKDLGRIEEHINWDVPDTDNIFSKIRENSYRAIEDEANEYEETGEIKMKESASSWRDIVPKNESLAEITSRYN